AFAADPPDGLAAVHVRKPDIHQHEIDMAVAEDFGHLRRVCGRERLELPVQGELLPERLAQIGIVVDDENLARRRHIVPPSPQYPTARRAAQAAAGRASPPHWPDSFAIYTFLQTGWTPGAALCWQEISVSRWRSGAPA